MSTTRISPYHEWGDKDFDWKALNEACGFFQRNLQRWARLFCLTKEKYGTLRLEWFDFGLHGVLGLINPRIMMWRGSNWVYITNDKITAITRKIGLSWLFWQYQRLIFNILTVIAVKKWSHISAEIVDEYEFEEILYKITKIYIGYDKLFEKVKVNDE